MRPVSLAGRAAARGFTMIEVVVTVAIIGIVLAVGVPQLAQWSAANKARGATEFYAEGVHKARAEALRHNAASRMVLIDNPDNGQSDWRVDICFPVPAKPCDAAGNWSTTAANASDDPEGAAGFKSVLRSSSGLPKTDVMVQSVSPDGASGLYFTTLGWVDTDAPTRITRIDVVPSTAYADAFHKMALLIPVAGIPIKCEPDAPAGDSRRCP